MFSHPTKKWARLVRKTNNHSRPIYLSPTASRPWERFRCSSFPELGTSTIPNRSEPFGHPPKLGVLAQGSGSARRTYVEEPLVRFGPTGCTGLCCHCSLARSRRFCCRFSSLWRAGGMIQEPKKQNPLSQCLLCSSPQRLSSGLPYRFWARVAKEGAIDVHSVRDSGVSTVLWLCSLVLAFSFNRRAWVGLGLVGCVLLSVVNAVVNVVLRAELRDWRQWWVVVVCFLGCCEVLLLALR